MNSERTYKALLVPLGGEYKNSPEEPCWGPRGVNPCSVLKATLNYGRLLLPGGSRSSAELEAGCPPACESVLATVGPIKPLSSAHPCDLPDCCGQSGRPAGLGVLLARLVAVSL